jgi:hypothetical protein
MSPVCRLPTALKGLSFDISQHGTAAVLADPDEVFRILLTSNTVAVARRKTASLETVTVNPPSLRPRMTALAHQQDLKTTRLRCRPGGHVTR